MRVRPNQTVSEGQAVLLNGSNSTDPDDGIASYHWVQIGEPTVNLSDPNAMQPTFTTPDVGSEGAALTFELTVKDHNGNQGKDMCVVNVTWQNEPPQANAGTDQTVDEGVVVMASPLTCGPKSEFQRSPFQIQRHHNRPIQHRTLDLTALPLPLSLQ
jgi:hypothetical protein